MDLASAVEIYTAGVDPLTMFIIGVGLSIVAGLLLKQKSPLASSNPTTLTERGSYLTWMLGVRPIGPVFGHAGKRVTAKEKLCSGGKDAAFGGAEQDVFYEYGVHWLSVGPAACLHRIEQSGKVIFNGPITPDSHPSGSTVNLGKEGVFRIYWGEDNQPIDSAIASEMGVSSRWPGICYVVWDRKRLSTSPTWPILKYILEVRPTDSVVTRTSSWFGSTQTLGSTARTVVGATASTDEDTGFLEVVGSPSELGPKRQIGLVGTGLADGTYTIKKVLANQAPIGTTFNGYQIFEARMRVFLEGGTAGATGAGTITAYTAGTDSGANAAHLISHMLFEPWPHGTGHDPNSILEPWDIESLETMGEEVVANGWRFSLVSEGGKNVRDMLGGVLQDLGCLLTLDPAQGNMTFVRLREPTGSVPTIPEGLMAGSKPKIKTQLGPQAKNRISYSISDRDHGFHDMPITIRDDGQVAVEKTRQDEVVPIVSTVHFDTGSDLAELRSGEVLSKKAPITIRASRGARYLRPGDPYLLAGFPQRVRVLSNRVNTLSERTELTLVPDFYTRPLTGFDHNTGGGQVAIVGPEPDALQDWAEVPEQLIGGIGSTQTVMTLRIRANANILNAVVHISSDNSTFTLKSATTVNATGGTLADALPVGDAVLESGPTYNELGPDNATLTQDLSGDLASWGLGRQLAVIVSTAGTEVCFLRRATIVSGGVRRLEGLIRARYDTRQLSHPVGAKVFIFDVDNFFVFQDPILGIGTDLYVKYQPGTTGGVVPLDAASALGERVTGKGQKPIKPDQVYVKAPYLAAPTFEAGGNLTIAWLISSGSVVTGAGLQGAGTAIGEPVVPGSAVLDFLTIGGSSVGTLSADADQFERVVTNAELVALFGSEPTSFRVRVTHSANGLVSDASPDITITRI